MSEVVKKTLQPSLTQRLRFLSSHLAPLIVVVAALCVGAVLILVAGHDPIQAYLSLFHGAFGGMSHFSETLVKAIPLLLMGLAISIAFKNSFWNIGGEGQFIAGAIFATWTALTFARLPGVILTVLCFVAGFAGGAIWCLIAALLKVRFKVNEVISTLMLNYVASFSLMFLIRGPMKDQSSQVLTGQVFPQTALIPQSLYLPILIDKTRLHAGLFVVAAALILVWLLWRTQAGFEIELSGANKEAAQYAGINVNRVILLTAILSGGIAGLVGWSEIFGIYHRLLDAITSGYGFLGLVVALLGGLHPLGILISALLFSALTVGGNAMERATGVTYSVVSVINGLIIIFLLVRVALQRSIMGEEE
jgi:simple sugar transport system permease protein